MSFVEQIFNQFQQRFFESVVNNRLIYNSCWEDPRIDRELLDINSDSKIVMLTSAGCNALDYLLDGADSIHCVDRNPAQNALLELKQSLYYSENYTVLWEMFGKGHYCAANTIYHRNLRDFLSAEAQKFWDHHIDYFLPTSSTPSFYFRGTSGSVAHIVHKHIHHKGLYNNVLNLIDAQSLAEQRYYFGEIEPQLWNAFSRWLLKRDATMAMLGVPRGQRMMVDKDVSGGISAFIKQAIQDVFLNQSVKDNYFWRVYLTGSYTTQCCPNYLKEKHFGKLIENVDQIYKHTTSITNFLKCNPGCYSHFVLLDHQDWLANQQPQKLEEEWKLILSNARAGAKILFRSAGQTRSFIPDFVHSHVSFDDDITRQLHTKDRVGTYGSTHLAIVNQRQ
ncbi:MAG: BtaA family protein [Balneolaceae bacterium]|nr:BtaA family protein [Balneolaceae bacterium]